MLFYGRFLSMSKPTIAIAMMIAITPPITVDVTLLFIASKLIGVVVTVGDAAGAWLTAIAVAAPELP